MAKPSASSPRVHSNLTTRRFQRNFLLLLLLQDGSSPSSFFETSTSSNSLRERRWSRWSNNHAALARSKRTLHCLQHQFATQAFLCCLVFFFAWFFQGITAALLQRFTETSDPIYLPFAILMAIFSPLQGFWNFFTCIRPRHLRYRRKQRHEEEKQNQREHEGRADGRAIGTHRAAALYKAMSADFPVELDDEDDGDDHENLNVPSNEDKNPEGDDDSANELMGNDEPTESIATRTLKFQCVGGS